MSDKLKKETAMEGSEQSSGAEVLDSALVARGFLGSPTGSAQTELQCGCKRVSPQEEGAAAKVDAVDSLLKCVKCQEKERDRKGNSTWEEIEKVKNFIMEYKAFVADSEEEEEEEEEEEPATSDVDVDEGEQEEESEITLKPSVIFVENSLLDPEVEEELRSWKEMSQQAAKLQSVFTDILPDEIQEPVDAPRSPKVETPSVRELLSPVRRIAEATKELQTKEECPDATLPVDLEESLDKCAQMLAALDKPNA